MRTWSPRRYPQIRQVYRGFRHRATLKECQRHLMTAFLTERNGGKAIRRSIRNTDSTSECWPRDSEKNPLRAFVRIDPAMPAAV